MKKQLNILSFQEAKDLINDPLSYVSFGYFRIKVSDNWYGNYISKDGLADEAEIYLVYLGNDGFRLVASGNDDFMLGLDEPENELKISKIFNHLKDNPNQIYNQQWFLDKGMLHE